MLCLWYGIECRTCTSSIIGEIPGEGVLPGCVGAAVGGEFVVSLLAAPQNMGCKGGGDVEVEDLGGPLSREHVLV